MRKNKKSDFDQGLRVDENSNFIEEVKLQIRVYPIKGLIFYKLRGIFEMINEI